MAEDELTETLVMGAKNIPSNKKPDQNNYPDIEEEFSYNNFEKYIINSKQNFKQLESIILEADLSDCQIRFSVWRILLKSVPMEFVKEEFIEILQKQRHFYLKNLDEFKKQQPVKVENKKVLINPLAPKNQNPISGFFEDEELRKDIKKDVERTYQDIGFFQYLNIKQILTNILFVWSKLNPSISYRQGMNEIVASLIIIYFTEALFIHKNEKTENVKNEIYDIAKFCIDLEYVEADVFTVFNCIQEIGQKEMFVHAQDKKPPKGSKKYISPINNRVAKIQHTLLKMVDNEMFRHLKLLEMEFSVFLLRWIKCMFTREFQLDHSFILWDNIFLDYYNQKNDIVKKNTGEDNDHNDQYFINNFLLIDTISLAMMVSVKKQVMDKEDASDCLQQFLKYSLSPQTNIKNIIEQAYIIKDKILNYNPEKEQQEKEKQQQNFLKPQIIQKDQKKSETTQKFDPLKVETKPDPPKIEEPQNQQNKISNQNQQKNPLTKQQNDKGKLNVNNNKQEQQSYIFNATEIDSMFGHLLQAIDKLNMIKMGNPEELEISRCAEVLQFVQREMNKKIKPKKQDVQGVKNNQEPILFKPENEPSQNQGFIFQKGDEGFILSKRQ